MGIIYQKDSRSSITYVYENTAYWDKDKKQSRAKRRLVGRLDPVTGEILPTDGRCKKLSPDYIPTGNEYEMPKTMSKLKAEVRRLLKENEYLRKQLEQPIEE